MIPVHTDIQVPYTTDRSRASNGEVRAIDGKLCAFDGGQWIPVYTTGWVDSIELGSVVEWAKRKMEQELKEQQLAEKYPAFAKAKENYEIVKALVENE